MARSFASESIGILSFEAVGRELPDLPVSRLDLDDDEYRHWLGRVLPGHASISADVYDKKKLEFFASYTLLDAANAASFLDAAGGNHSYADRVPARRAWVQDLEFAAGFRERIASHVGLIRSDAEHIPLDDASVDAIACHHSFEHFQGRADVAFIREVQRLLAPGGRALIVPVFIAAHFAEITNDPRFSNFDSDQSLHVYDAGDALPGGRRSGHYARVYDPGAFRRRVLDTIDRRRFDVALFELTIGGREIPDMSLACHAEKSYLNVPYRALRIVRR